MFNWKNQDTTHATCMPWLADTPGNNTGCTQTGKAIDLHVGGSYSWTPA